MNRLRAFLACRWTSIPPSRWSKQVGGEPLGLLSASPRRDSREAFAARSAPSENKRDFAKEDRERDTAPRPGVGGERRGGRSLDRRDLALLPTVLVVASVHGHAAPHLRVGEPFVFLRLLVDPAARPIAHPLGEDRRQPEPLRGRETDLVVPEIDRLEVALEDVSGARTARGDPGISVDRVQRVADAGSRGTVGLLVHHARIVPAGVAER